MGYIFDIQRFCIHDGPGIRTTVFLKGCPLRCKWCHNPEGLEKYPQVMYSPDKCISCGLCSAVCGREAHKTVENTHEFDISKCTSCMKCTDNICPAEALKAAGCEMSAESIIKAVLDDVNFFSESGGGLTLSGGEPFFQPDFTLELLKLAKKEGLNTAVETSGFALESAVKEAAKYTDLFLFDWKISKEEKHIEYTGVSQKKIETNLSLLNSLSANIILRCPIIPGINTEENHYKTVGELTKRYKSIEKVHVMPYHSIGVGKYGKVGKNAPFSAPTMKYAEANETANSIRRFSSVEVEIM